MENNFLTDLSGMELFSEIGEDDLRSLITCLSPNKRNFKKDEIIYFAGDTVSAVGIVLSGFIQVVSEDIFGNRNIISGFGKNQMFAESFACAKTEALPVSVISASDSEVLFLDYGKVLHRCSSACSHHTKLVENMLSILAHKNILLSKKMNIMSRRSIRGKLLAYLAGEAQKQKNLTFEIDFDRQELADYLCVDRSALSSELSRLQNEGVLEFKRSRFKLKKTSDIDIFE